jgi:hypothetical protein
MHLHRERVEALERFARRQEWSISSRQLYSLGFTLKEILGMVDRGYLHRVHRGVYAVGRRQLTRRGWLFAALLACGEESFLSHRTAIALKGLCRINPYAIHVTFVGSESRRRSGLIIHRARVQPFRGEVRTQGGLRASSIYRALVEAAGGESRPFLDQVIELAMRKKMLDIASLEKAIDRHAGARGAVNLRAAFAAYRPRRFDKSGLERSVAAAIAADPSIPTPERNVHYEAGDIRWEIDFFWRQERVALETDGGQYHLTPQDKERDRIKDAKLMAEGITPMRITDVRWELDPGGAIEDLRAILRAAFSRIQSQRRSIP